MASSARDTPARQRNALIPGIIAATALVAGLPLIGTDAALIICFIVAIFALIVGWFALQARQWWWVAIMLVIAVLWNPVYPFGFTGPVWLVAHIVASALFVVAGVLISVVRPGTEPNRR